MYIHLRYGGLLPQIILIPLVPHTASVFLLKATLALIGAMVRPAIALNRVNYRFRGRLTPGDLNAATNAHPPKHFSESNINILEVLSCHYVAIHSTLEI